MDVSLIVPKDDATTRLYSGLPKYKISGIDHFCSGALLCNSIAPYVAKYSIQNWAACKQAIPYKKCNSIAHWFDVYKSSSIYAVPREYILWYLYEAVLDKCVDGTGGRYDGEYPMYAGNCYATRTWFMADRRRDETQELGFSILHLMHDIQERGTAVMGRIHISPWADGAHGGSCKGAVWAPNIAGMLQYRDGIISSLNSHAKQCAKELRTAEEPIPDDAVCNHW